MSSSRVDEKKPQKKTKSRKAENEAEDGSQPQKKKRRTTKKKAFQTECDTSLLGRVFMSSHPYRCGDAVRIVGWTKKMFIVDSVPLHISSDSKHGGGSMNIDWEWVRDNPVTEPVTKGGLKAKLMEGESMDPLRPGVSYSLLCAKEFYFEREPGSKGSTWCEY
jgi:hypothetical protein